MIKTPMRKQDMKWLRLIALDGGGMGYPGERRDHVPDSVSRRLYARGLIEVFFPQNSAHKDRWIATEAGKQLVEEEQA